MRALFWIAAALVLGAPAARADMVASDNRAALCMERLAADFEARGGTVMDPFASPPEKVLSQIQSAVPFAMAVTLDSDLAEEMDRQGLALEVFELPSSPLCLWSREEFSATTWRLQEPGVVVALADPRQDPMGIPAERWLRDQGLWEKLQQEGRLLLRPTALEAAELALSGAADLALAPGLFFWNAGGSLMTLPPEGTRTFGALLKGSGAGARAFRDYLTSPEALPVWRSCGFGRR